MTRDVIDIKGFTILVEADSPDEVLLWTYRFEEPFIAVQQNGRIMGLSSKALIPSLKCPFCGLF